MAAARGKKNVGERLWMWFRWLYASTGESGVVGEEDAKEKCAASFPSRDLAPLIFSSIAVIQMNCSEIALLTRLELLPDP